MESVTIKDALHMYDKNKDKFSSLVKSVAYVKKKDKSGDIESNIIGLYDKNDKLLYKAKYELIGLFNHQHDLWVWGWAVPNARKNLTYSSRQVLQYGLDIDYTKDHLKTELITSRLEISSPIQIDINLAVASMLVKTPFIYKLTINPSLAQITDDNSDRIVNIDSLTHEEIKESDIDTDENIDYYYFLTSID